MVGLNKSKKYSLIIIINLSEIIIKKFMKKQFNYLIFLIKLINLNKMGFLERILLSLYYPQFKSPLNSRFETLFVSIIKMKNPLNKLINRSNTIYPEKIARNEDKRTSIVIKGIPKNMSKNEVRNLLDKFGNINFLYIINSQTNKNNNNTSIAFVNVINFKSIIPLFMNLRNYKIEKFGKTYNLKISYSSVQGKPKLKEFIQQYKFSKY